MEYTMKDAKKRGIDNLLAEVEMTLRKQIETLCDNPKGEDADWARQNISQLTPLYDCILKNILSGGGAGFWRKKSCVFSEGRRCSCYFPGHKEAHGRRLDCKTCYDYEFHFLRTVYGFTPWLVVLIGSAIFWLIAF